MFTSGASISINFIIHVSDSADKVEENHVIDAAGQSAYNKGSGPDHGPRGMNRKEVFFLYRKLTAAACILWIAGIAAFIIGLNIPGNTGKWLSVTGQIAFFLGLGLEGVLWVRRRKTQAAEDPGKNEKPEEPSSPRP